MAVAIGIVAGDSPAILQRFLNYSFGLTFGAVLFERFESADVDIVSAPFFQSFLDADLNLARFCHVTQCPRRSLY